MFIKNLFIVSLFIQISLKTQILHNIWVFKLILELLLEWILSKQAISILFDIKVKLFSSKKTDWKALQLFALNKAP